MQTAVDVSSDSPPQDVTFTDANTGNTSPSVVIVDSQKEKRQSSGSYERDSWKTKQKSLFLASFKDIHMRWGRL